MDLSLRAFLKGWKFVWRYDIICPNEIPSDYKAYRKQQRRWSCGPMQLWAAARQSVSESALPPLHKAYLNIFFFGVRMLATNVISFTFYSVCAITHSKPYWSVASTAPRLTHPAAPRGRCSCR